MLKMGPIGFWIFLQFVLQALGASFNDTETIYNNIFSTYQKELRPGLDNNSPVVINIYFYLAYITEFDDVKGKLTTVGFFEIKWNDHRIVWDPKLFGDTDSIVIPEDKVWIPPIYLINSNSETKPLGSEQKMYIFFNSKGNSRWTPRGMFTTICSANVKNYPFDKHTCILSFYISMYKSYQVLLQAADPATNSEHLEASGVWELRSLKGESAVFYNASNIIYTVTFSRKSDFFIVTLLLPILLMGVLNIFVFILPAASGERIGYSVTIVLSFSVYLSIVASGLPTTAQPGIATICYFLLSDLVMSATITLCTVITLIVYNKDDTRERIPYWIMKFTIYMQRSSFRLPKTKLRGRGRNSIGNLQQKVNPILDTNGKPADNDTEKFDDNKLDQDKQSAAINVKWKDFAHILDIVFLTMFILWILISSIIFLPAILL